MAGPWHSCEMKASDFWATEADVEAAFTRVEAIRKLWGYQCLPPVRLCEVLGAAAQGGYSCPFTGRHFLPGETVWPCYVRLTMGGVRSGEIMQHIVVRLLESEFHGSPHFCRHIEERERVVLRDSPTGICFGNIFRQLLCFWTDTAVSRPSPRPRCPSFDSRRPKMRYHTTGHPRRQSFWDFGMTGRRGPLVSPRSACG